jgi:hypothetical protein
MYLLKQWRESRILTGLAILGLLLLLYLVIKGATTADLTNFNDSGHNHPDFSIVFMPIFYIEAVLISFWGWLIASIGSGKSIGEDSGSFLFTRPRRRAWFLWNDWGFAMAQIAAIIGITNLMVGLLLAHIIKLVYGPGASFHYADGRSLILPINMLLISVGVLLCAGLIYSLTYFSTIVLKRAMGIMLGAGLLVGYGVLRLLMYHYYPAVHLPNLTITLFHIREHGQLVLSNNLAISIAIRTLVMLAFPFAAQLILDRAEI